MSSTILFKFKQTSGLCLLLGGLTALLPLSGRAVQSVTLAWNPSVSQNVRGYEICYGGACRQYTDQITVSKNSTNATIWGLQGGKTYFFAARAFKTADEQSDYSEELSYTVPPDSADQPPLLTSGLSSKPFVTGQNLALSMTAIGTGVLRYQWNFNGQILPGATNAVLTLINATPDQAGTYSVTVSDDVGTTNSSAAELTLHVPAASNEVAATLTTVTGLATMNDGSAQYAFDVSGIAGDRYVVEASADLQVWTSVQTNTAPFTFVDATVKQSGQQFYRVVHQ